MIAGLTEVLYEVGYQKTTVSLIGGRASVSKSDFYKHFASKDDCFFAAYEAGIERIRKVVTDACAGDEKSEWSSRVPMGIRALLDFLARDPALASLSLVEGLRAGRGVYDRYQAAVESFVPYLRRGAPPTPDGDPVPAATDEAVVGGIASLLGRRVLAGEAEQIDKLAPDVLEFALTPYLGATEARRIISAG
ncbi:MAG TPA: TetR/AcrR family transcriptional regulator [Solirubrobacterales bacterium]|nr:TetR/AcrR family transcriptional regulator [Solirubrobacterales bacterium]